MPPAVLGGRADSGLRETRAGAGGSLRPGRLGHPLRARVDGSAQAGSAAPPQDRAPSRSSTIGSGSAIPSSARSACSISSRELPATAICAARSSACSRPGGLGPDGRRGSARRSGKPGARKAAEQPAVRAPVREGRAAVQGTPPEHRSVAWPARHRERRWAPAPGRCARRTRAGRGEGPRRSHPTRRSSSRSARAAGSPGGSATRPGRAGRRSTGP